MNVHDSSMTHVPVMLQEVLTGLAIRPGAVIIDGTLGLAGHAMAALTAGGQEAKLIGIDRDLSAIAQAKINLKTKERQTLIFHGTYDQMEECWRSSGWPAADAVLLDLGVSSLQLDTGERGFSFRNDAALDMRMNSEDELSAYDVVNGYDEVDLARIIFEYGEERASRKIAKSIVWHRNRAPITTTTQLANLVAGVMSRGKKSKHHPAIRTFQALRLEVNNELTILKSFLASPKPFLKVGGRLAIISFHSLEDRLVKQFGKANSEEFKSLSKKPLVASETELEQNIRSRSAKLRVFEKVS